MMRVVAISDTHNRHRELQMPDGDILIHAGDSTNTGRLHEIASFANWLLEQSLRYPHVIFIGGNHDFLLQSDPYLARSMFHRPNVHYLERSGIEINGKVFWGAPDTPMGANWAFGRTPEAMRDVWSKIPANTEVLITHTPPFGVLDYVSEEQKLTGGLGCHSLIRAVARNSPKFHVFGHIHQGYGTYTSNSGIKFYNAALWDFETDQMRQPVVFEID